MAPYQALRSCCLLATIAAAPAQEMIWRLPPLGAAEYRREWRAAASEPARTAAAARALPANGKVPERYLHRLPPAPWVCQGEVRADQSGIGGAVRDLRDLMRSVACELGGRTAVQATFPRLLPYGDVAVSGTWTQARADGTQSLRANVSSRLPAGSEAQPLRPYCLPGLQGQLQIERRVDAARGVVETFRAVLDVVVEEDPKAHRRLLVEDEWVLVAVRENQDADFRNRVGAAIRAGVGFVREAIDEKKSFLVDSGGDERNFGSGRLALGLLTLLHGYVPAADPVLVRGFDDLRRRRLEDTYSLATALMAAAARHGQPGGVPRDERDTNVAQKWLQQLLANVDPRTDRAQVLRFNYVAGPRYDTSLQQYGLLGLWSAHCLGLQLPDGTFAAAARQLLAVQGPPGRRQGLQLTTYVSLREAAGTEDPPRSDDARAVARGFAYQEPDEPPFGSMTSAGISGLLLARSGILTAGGGDRALVARIDDAVRDGFGWLAAEFSVRSNPGFAERADHHWYYWLHGLERSCELAGVAWLQGRDWYYEGALQLLSQQQANGSFRAEQASSLLLDTTCFAVLFLAKARPAAVVTPR